MLDDELYKYIMNKNNVEVVKRDLQNLLQYLNNREKKEKILSEINEKEYDNFFSFVNDLFDAGYFDE